QRTKRSQRLGPEQVGRAISAIGKKAGIKVKTDPDGNVKFASAHDLRRSFGDRWARKVMPQVLMELMRHESIDTTMKYYVGRNAEATADVLWSVHEQASNISGNTSGISPTKPPAANAANPGEIEGSEMRLSGLEPETTD